jgi:hypothetical protein
VVAYLDVRQDVDNLADGSFAYAPGIPFGATALPMTLTATARPDFGLSTALSGVDYDREVQDRSLGSGLAWSHSFGYRNVATVGVFTSGFERSSREEGEIDLDGVIFDLDTGAPLIGPFDLQGEQAVEAEFNQSTTIGAVSHLIGVGDATFRYGAEGGRVSQEQSEISSATLILPGPPNIALPLSESSTEYELELDAYRAYVDAVYEITPTLTAEAGLFGTFLRSDEVTVNGADGGEIDISRAEPRFGLAWEPIAGQMLRVGYLRESGAFSAASLAPVGVVGLQANQLRSDHGLCGYAGRPLGGGVDAPLLHGRRISASGVRGPQHPRSGRHHHGRSGGRPAGPGRRHRELSPGRRARPVRHAGLHGFRRHGGRGCGRRLRLRGCASLRARNGPAGWASPM